MEERAISAVNKKLTLFNNTKLQQMKNCNILHIVYTLALAFSPTENIKCREWL
jgi:hypothetical protein